MSSRIICIGNRFFQPDRAGPSVYERLHNMPLPAGVQVIEGGLAGLNLLPLLEQGGRVVFVDAVQGFGLGKSIVVLGSRQIVECLDQAHYGHAAGLPYLLTALPLVCTGTLPEDVFLVGLEGVTTSQVLDRAAAISLDLALGRMEAATRPGQMHPKTNMTGENA